MLRLLSCFLILSLFTSKTIRVGLGTTVADSGYVIGNTFFQDGTNATGDLVGTAGSVTGKSDDI